MEDIDGDNDWPHTKIILIYVPMAITLLQLPALYIAHKKAPYFRGSTLFFSAILRIGSGGRIRTYDLRVMSPTSCQTAPPRTCADQRKYKAERFGIQAFKATL